MMNDQRPESTRLVSIHPPPATILAVIEELLKDPTSALRESPRNIRLTEPDLVYVLVAVIEECNRHHQIVHDGLVKNNERAETRIRSEGRKYRELVLERNNLKSELERMRESMAERKNIRTDATSLVSSCSSRASYWYADVLSLQGDSVMHQSEDGETASASKLELAATPAHVSDDCTFTLKFTKEAIYRPGKPLVPSRRTTLPIYKACSLICEPYGILLERCSCQITVRD